jgi:hypothetical protein
MERKYGHWPSETTAALLDIEFVAGAQVWLER